MNVWCPDINCQRTILTCIYRCKINTKCAEYTKLYEKICEEPVEEKYIEKYGQPLYPEPIALVKKQKAAEKKLKDDAKKAIINEKKAAKKAREQAKNKKESEKRAKVLAREQRKAEKEAKKGKHTRRTREQILADLHQQTPQPEPVLVQKKTRQRKVLLPAKKGTIPPEVDKVAVQEVAKRRSTADKFAMFDEEPVIVVEPPKQKRHRRTKAEMEADKKSCSWC